MSHAKISTSGEFLCIVNLSNCGQTPLWVAAAKADLYRVLYTYRPVSKNVPTIGVTRQTSGSGTSHEVLSNLVFGVLCETSAEAEIKLLDPRGWCRISVQAFPVKHSCSLCLTSFFPTKIREVAPFQVLINGGFFNLPFVILS